MNNIHPAQRAANRAFVIGALLDLLGLFLGGYFLAQGLNNSALAWGIVCLVYFLKK